MIGETLRKERENQKLSVQDVEKETSIRALYIEAIEQGEYDKLPGEVYAKGFIKNYANFLNLDGEALVKQFIIEISPTIVEFENKNAEAEISNEVVVENKSKITAMSSAMKKVRASRTVELENTPAEEEDNESAFIPRKYLIAVVAVVAFLAGGLLLNFNGNEEPPVIDYQPQQGAQPPAPAQEIFKNPTPEPQPVPVASGVDLQATFSADCWTRVVVDGILAYEGMINAGQVFNWNGNENIYVRLGNAGAAQFVMNGQNIGAIGQEGAVVDRVFVR